MMVSPFLKFTNRPLGDRLRSRSQAVDQDTAPTPLRDGTSAEPRRLVKTPLPVRHVERNRRRPLPRPARAARSRSRRSVRGTPGPLLDTYPEGSSWRRPLGGDPSSCCGGFPPPTPVAQSESGLLIRSAQV